MLYYFSNGSKRNIFLLKFTFNIDFECNYEGQSFNFFPRVTFGNDKRNLDAYTFSHCESASVQLRSAECIGVVSWGTTSTKVASYRHSAPLRQGALNIDAVHLADTGHRI